jgi:ribosome-associated protein
MGVGVAARAGGYYTGRLPTDREAMRDDAPSKTQRKLEMQALQALGQRLVGLNTAQLATLALPEPLGEAVADAQRIRSREGLRRQLQYIGRLMREVDPAPIRAQLEVWDGRSRTATAAHHQAERWRDRLLGDDAALTEFARAHPRADLQRLRACVREARKEQLAGREPRHFRELFRLIRNAAADDAPGSL